MLRDHYEDHHHESLGAGLQTGTFVPAKMLTRQGKFRSTEPFHSVFPVTDGAVCLRGTRASVRPPHTPFYGRPTESNGRAGVCVSASTLGRQVLGVQR
jgi:hypothetical protein